MPVRLSPLLLSLAGACHGDPDGPDVELGPRVQCADPGARTASPFDRVEEGDWFARPPGDGALGAVVADLDGDGLDDVFLPAGATARMFRGTRRGLVDETERTPPQEPGVARTASAADVDGDGDLDLFRAGPGAKDVILRNDGAGWFDEEPIAVGGTVVSSAWGDLDLDGDLDLVIANAQPDGPVLFLNDGAGRFELHDELLPEGFADGGNFQTTIIDLDQDGWPDLYRAIDAANALTPNNDRHTNLVAWNRGGRFEADDGFAGLNVAICSMGVGIGDLNGDLRPDLGVTDCQQVHLYQSTEVGVWVDHAAVRELRVRELEVPWGIELLDLDNDADLDAYVAYGWMSSAKFPIVEDERDAVYVQDEDGRFRDEGAAWGVVPGHSRGFSYGDLNDDGFLDVIGSDLTERPEYYRSRCSAAAWSRVRLRQDGPNPFAVGATVVAEARGEAQIRWITAGGTSIASGHGPDAHFGLGDADRVDLEVTWPDGAVDRWDDVPTRRVVTLRRP